MLGLRYRLYATWMGFDPVADVAAGPDVVALIQCLTIDLLATWWHLEDSTDRVLEGRLLKVFLGVLFEDSKYKIPFCFRCADAHIDASSSKLGSKICLGT